MAAYNSLICLRKAPIRDNVSLGVKDLYRDLTNSLAKGVIVVTATNQWDKVQDGLGYETPFQN